MSLAFGAVVSAQRTPKAQDWDAPMVVRVCVCVCVSRLFQKVDRLRGLHTRCDRWCVDDHTSWCMVSQCY